MPQTYNPSLGRRFGLLFRLNTHFLNHRLKSFGISAGQVSCLAELLHNKVPVTQEEISSTLAVDPAATARTVNLLIKKGLAARVVNPENRRQKLVSATLAARQMEKDFFYTLKDIEKNFNEDLTVQEHRILLDFMDRMISTAKRRKHESAR